jgi:hypothetical protein
MHSTTNEETARNSAERRIENDRFVIIRRTDNRSEIYRTTDSGLEMFVCFAPATVTMREVERRLS